MIEHSWQYRAVERTKANSTPLGMILLGVLGKASKYAPRVSNAAAIMPSGAIVVNFLDREGHYHAATNLDEIAGGLGTVGELTDAFRRLADDLKLEDHERIDMFKEVRQWLAIDYRVMKDFDFGGGYSGRAN